MPLEAQRSTGVAVPTLNVGARWEWVVNATPQPLYPWERNPVPIIQEAGWAPEQVWTSVEKKKSPAPTGVRNVQPVPSCCTH